LYCFSSACFIIIFFFLIVRRPPISTLFPTRRSSDLYCPPAGDRVVKAGGPIKVRRLAGGPLVAALEDRFEIGRRVGVRLVVMMRSEEHTSELQSRFDLVCRLLLEKKKKTKTIDNTAS